MAERPQPLEQVALTLHHLRVEVSGSWRLAGDTRSFLRLWSDSLGYRVQGALGADAGSRRRSVKFKDGTELVYRLNRGDVRAIAEVWISETYRLPFEIRARNVVDLGSNIGSAGLWLARRYGAAKLVAVEPVPANAELARLNFRRNGIDATVLEAAAGEREGTTTFEVSSNSAVGRIGGSRNGAPGIGGSEIEVEVVTPRRVIELFPAGEPIDLMKIDIEGAEQALFAGDTSWLDRVDCLVMELHKAAVDWQSIIGLIERRGFTYFPIGADNTYAGFDDLIAAFRRNGDPV